MQLRSPPFSGEAQPGLACIPSSTYDFFATLIAWEPQMHVTAIHLRHGRQAVGYGRADSDVRMLSAESTQQLRKQALAGDRTRGD